MAQTLELTDAQVIRRVQLGEREDFRVLVDRYLKTVHAVAYSVLRNQADAEDVTQETFLKAYRSLRSLRDTGRFKGWLVTIARNTCYKVLSSRKRAPEAVGEMVDAPVEAAADLDRAELRALLRKQVGELEVQHREVLMLHYFAGQSTRELAETLGISVSAVKKRLGLRCTRRLHLGQHA